MDLKRIHFQKYNFTFSIRYPTPSNLINNKTTLNLRLKKKKLPLFFQRHVNVSKVDMTQLINTYPLHA